MSSYFLEVLKEKDFTISDVFVEIKKDFPTLKLDKIEPLLNSLVKIKVHIAAISYNTVDPNNEPTVSSGIIIQPINRKPRGVLHFLPSANIDKLGSGSDALLIFEGLLAFFGYTVIIADLLGNGITKDTKEYPFLLRDNTGRVAYDMHRAAMEYFPQVLGYPLQKHITIGGYSLGGSSALALVRHIERVNPDDIIIDRAIVGGGIYDIKVALSEFIRTGIASYPAAPSIMKSFDYWYNLNLDYTKIFIDPLLSHMDTWLDRTHNRFELTEWIGQDVHKYLQPDFFKPELNSEFKKLWSKLDENSLICDWTPKTKLRMSHACDDLTVPKKVAEYTYRELKKRGANVRMHYGKGDHYEFGKWYFIRMIIYLMSKRLAFWTRS